MATRRRRKGKTAKEIKSFLKSGILWISIVITISSVAYPNPSLCEYVWIELPLTVRYDSLQEMIPVEFVLNKINE